MQLNEQKNWDQNMRFESTKVTNWGPFRESQEIDLQTTDGAPVVLIFGENGKGKTSFAKAIRWCLYGEESGINPVQHANWTKIRENVDFEVGVTVTFSVMSSSGEVGVDETWTTYEIERSFTARPDGRTTFGVSARDHSVTLKRQGDGFIDQIPKFIKKYLPLEMSRFFLFDGEELNSLKTELEGGGVSSGVKDGIESVMGIPALKELDTLVRDQQKIIDRSHKSIQGHRESEQELELAKLELERKTEELNGNKRDLKRAEEEKAEIIAEMARFKEVSDKIAQKNQIMKSRDRASQEARSAQSDIKQAFDDFWWVPLADQIMKSQERETKQRIIQKERNELVARLKALQSILETGRCATCGQNAGLNDAERAEMAQLRDQLSTNADESATRSGFIERFNDPNVQRVVIRDLLIDERRALAVVRSEEDELRIIEMQLADVDEEKTNGLLPKLQNLERFEGGLKVLVDQGETEVVRLRGVESEKRKALMKLGGIPESQENLSKALQQLQEIAGVVRETFRDKVREEVAGVASSHYVKMMENEDLVGIDITSDFRVRPINRFFDEPKPLSSYGQSLVAVYAFIGALIDVSGNNGSWLIDTVGSRLDKDKMRSVWEWLSSRDRQVIAMPHSGELTKSDAMSLIGGRVSRRYEIVDASNRDSDSQIKEILS